jgi:hypothetical protein
LVKQTAFPPKQAEWRCRGIGFINILIVPECKHVSQLTLASEVLAGSSRITISTDPLLDCAQATLHTSSTRFCNCLPTRPVVLASPSTGSDPARLEPVVCPPMPVPPGGGPVWYPSKDSSYRTVVSGARGRSDGSTTNRATTMSCSGSIWSYVVPLMTLLAARPSLMAGW